MVKYNLRSLLLHLSSLLGHITQRLNLGALLRGGFGVPNLLLHLSCLLSYISQSLDLCALLGGGHLLAACWRRICLALLWGSRWCRETYYWTLPTPVCRLVTMGLWQRLASVGVRHTDFVFDLIIAVFNLSDWVVGLILSLS